MAVEACGDTNSTVPKDLGCVEECASGMLNERCGAVEQLGRQKI